ncbi:MAG: DNA polymerase III subunit delta' [Deltaproteobacteria bacterium]|nr:DNA polymerase III subunit delta' [Deltaproteobacteria bacterium]
MRIYGHEQQLTMLRDSARANRLANTYLFYGMEGIGKKLVAMEFARSLLCPVSAPVACGECTSCRKALNGNHPDIFVFIPPTASIKIDEIRLLQEKSILRPFEATRKIFIIDDVEKMTRDAANAFLKTLEEPPESCVFFLITARYRSLLPTVLSRCQKIPFSPLSDDDLTKLLGELTSCDPLQARTVATLAGGSAATALAMFQEDFLAHRSNLFGALQRLILQKEMGIFSFVKAMGSDKEEVAKSLDIVRSAFRDVALFLVRQDTAGVINRDVEHVIREMAQRFSLRHCTEVSRIIHSAMRGLTANANKQLLLEALGLKIIGKMRG